MKTMHNHFQLFQACWCKMRSFYLQTLNHNIWFNVYMNGLQTLGEVKFVDYEALAHFLENITYWEFWGNQTFLKCFVPLLDKMFSVIKVLLCSKRNLVLNYHKYKFLSQKGLQTFGKASAALRSQFCNCVISGCFRKFKFHKWTISWI